MSPPELPAFNIEKCSFGVGRLNLHILQISDGGCRKLVLAKASNVIYFKCAKCYVGFTMRPNGEKFTCDDAKSHKVNCPLLPPENFNILGPLAILNYSDLTKKRRFLVNKVNEWKEGFNIVDDNNN